MHHHCMPTLAVAASITKKKKRWVKWLAYFENTKKISSSLQAYVLVVDKLVQCLEEKKNSPLPVQVIIPGVRSKFYSA